MHIELTEMLRCPEEHPLDVLVLSTGEMLGRMVRSGILGCPVCRKEYPIVKGIVDFSGRGSSSPTRPSSPVPLPPEPQVLQALLDLSGPGGFVVLLGAAARHAAGLAALMGGIHFVGVDAPAGVEESPVLSLLRARDTIPLRPSMARGVVVGADRAGPPWFEEALGILLRGRRLVIEGGIVPQLSGAKELASGDGLWVGEKTR